MHCLLTGELHHVCYLNMYKEILTGGGGGLVASMKAQQDLGMSPAPHYKLTIF